MIIIMGKCLNWYSIETNISCLRFSPISILVFFIITTGIQIQEGDENDKYNESDGISWRG